MLGRSVTHPGYTPTAEPTSRPARNKTLTRAVRAADSLLAMTAARLLIGVDVGGTKTSVASMRGGAVGQPLVRPTERSSAEALLAQIVAQVREVAAGASPAAIGVAALAEAHDAQGRLDVRSLVMFTVGTGVGGGIVIDGRSYRGATGAAGEFGHTLIALSELIPAATRFPQPGSLESLAAGHVLDRLAREAATAHPESALGATLAARGSVAGPDAVAAAQAGDAIAIGCLATLGRRVGIGVANAINTFDPEVVAIGGGVSSAGDLLLVIEMQDAADGAGQAVALAAPPSPLAGAGAPDANAATRSPTIRQVRFGLFVTLSGNTLASATRRPSTPRTRSCASTTRPIAQLKSCQARSNNAEPITSR